MKATTGQILGKAHKLCDWLTSEATELKTSVGAVPMSWAVMTSSKWHVGHTDELPARLDRETIDSLPLRLPAKSMLIEYETEVRMADDRIVPMTGFALCFDHGTKLIDMFFFGAAAGRFGSSGGGRLQENALGRREFFPFERPDAKGEIRKAYRDEMNGVKVVERALAALGCNNVRSVDNPPSAALNRKRQKQGKLPLFTYKTLHVLAGERGASHDPRDDDAEAKRSPRLHFRRGHVRRLGDGRITWVQQCMVGNARLGMIEKAYVLEAR